ncbi:hypothetical protein PVAP13_5KG712000 [Panicum virgatum]|uniref:Uncharacterized protein n=1 Tax=Panicum virgatum TaxID=38727 RepID=A0A8T0T3J1_PANVG|nr:hypothetical protein PVAP13_5KG712000 [Panicum virgatum]
MARGCPTTTTSSLLLLFILSCLIIGHAFCNHGHHGRTSGCFPLTNNYVEQYPHQESPDKHIVSQETMKQGVVYSISDTDTPRICIGCILQKPDKHWVWSPVLYLLCGGNNTCAVQGRWQVNAPSISVGVSKRESVC